MRGSNSWDSKRSKGTTAQSSRVAVVAAREQEQKRKAKKKKHSKPALCNDLVPSEYNVTSEIFEVISVKYDNNNNKRKEKKKYHSNTCRECLNKAQIERYKNNHSKCIRMH